MKRVSIHIIIIFLFSCFYSCKNFLDEIPKHEITGETAINSAEKARQAVNGVYSTLQDDNWAGTLYIPLNTKAGFSRFSGTIDFTFGYNQTSGGRPAIWTQCYRSINAANFAITGISNLSEDHFPNKEDKSKLIAEARCLRAWFNIHLLWNFGHWWAEKDDPFGLLYRSEPSDLANISQSRISVGESYRLIYEDLDFAIANLPSFSSPRFVSNEFAKVLKAKILLYRGGYLEDNVDLQESLKLVNEVMNNLPSKIKLESNMNDLYKNSWDSQENIFVRYLENDGTRTVKSFSYSYSLVASGNVLPLANGATLTAGLTYGLDWFKADPRWNIATGEVRHPEAWANYNLYTFRKLARLGYYSGRLASPPDEKYATYFFRLAELYLMKSELLARTGASISDAIAPINLLRSSRTTPVFTSLHPSDRNDLMNLIFKEIFLELCLENGSEFFAAMRFKDNGKRWIEIIKGIDFEVTKNCWPIPDAEMMNNPLMVQNPELN